ncbi:MAG TPA: efflux RND transporter periplasmic adaptor subunit [Candidatus Acidoferrales bacterium]|nr:efflux RND transporter periplasmic adaptor subunit [Candidatus Acidoferrales bacterium]
MKIDVTEFCVRLLAEQEVLPRARTIAQTVAESSPGTTVNVYLLAMDSGTEIWIPKATSGEAGVKASRVTSGAVTLEDLRKSRSPLFFSGEKLRRESYAHLDIRRAVVSLAYVPLTSTGNLMGAIEIVDFTGAIELQGLAGLAEAARIGGVALIGALAYENERNDSLVSINRLTQFYDLEKVFASTLEMDKLLPIMGAKFREVMECEGINIWLMQPNESVELMHQAGRDATASTGDHQNAGEGIPGDVSDDGVAVLIGDPDDARLAARNDGVRDGVLSLVAVPIMDEESLVGVVEALNKTDGSAFDDDDLFVLTSLTETAAIALRNAGLLLAERKVEILQTLVTVSHEITSTLNLERMLQTIVNAPQVVIPYERAAIALEQRGRFKLSAVTGLTQINRDAPDIAPLYDVLQWAALSEEIIHVRQHGEEIDTEREETRDKFRIYFKQTGMRGFYALPLSDDAGRVGVLSLESRDPDFLEPVHIEILEVLAGQATVALRNAQMYKEVPFISLLEPVLERKRRFMALEKQRRITVLVLAAAVVIFLAACPLPMRLAGGAVVAPLRRAQVQPEFEGVVGKVFVHEGQPVTHGQVLAEMDAWDYRSALAEAQARYQSALLQMNHSLAANDGSEAGIQRTQADYWKSAVDRAQELLSRAELRSPMDGVVATPHVENAAGRRLQLGDTFAEIVDTSSAIVDVAVDDSEASLLRTGAKAAVKLNSYAMRTFHGTVMVVSPKAEPQGDARVFFARVLLANPDDSIRAGMEGRGKISVGWYPAGYVLFRRPVIWIYSKIWAWFGW